MYSAKLVHNINNWVSISGVAQAGILVENEENHYYFGLEEWINCPVFRKMKLGYLDCYRANTIVGVADRVVLFTYDTNDRNIYHVGNIHGVKQLDNKDINQIRTDLNQLNWLNQIQQDFNAIGDMRNIANNYQYMNCYNSNQITGGVGSSFILNIKYEKIEIFPKKKWVNLTNLNIGVNKKWKRLSIRYNIPDHWGQYF